MTRTSDDKKPFPRKPEEEELAKKLDDLASLQTELADRELDLVSVRTSLGAFERRYLAIVGLLYATLDETEAKISELTAQRHPSNRDVQRAAINARQTANESTAAVSSVDSMASKQVAASSDLKVLYREVAKPVHPDLTSDPTERNRRQQLMAEANLAYEQGDESALRKILEDFENSPEGVHGEGTAADLVRTIRKIAQVRNRIKAIASEAQSIVASDLYELMEKTDQVKKKNRDLLDEMARSLDAQIAAARERLQHMVPQQDAS